MKRRNALLVFCFLLSACSHLSARDCARTDWFQRGRSDAIAGDDDENLEGYQADCAASGGVDLARFQAGRLEGQQKFCTEENGYRLGLKGQRYHGECPEGLNEEFRKGQLAGERDHRRQTKEAELAKKEAELEKKERRLKDEEDKLKQRKKDLDRRKRP